MKRGSSNTDEISLSLSGAGGKFTQNIPVQDDSWHNIVTTFGGGIKKIFVDGTEVASASQTGSVASSISRVILGDQDLDLSATEPKIDDVRFYRGILTAQEISAIYNNGSGDVGAPKFDISSPATIQGSEGKIYFL